jgi:hypothetical protein
MCSLSLPVRRHQKKPKINTTNPKRKKPFHIYFVHVRQIPEELKLGAKPLPVAPGGVQTAQDIHRAPDQRGGPPRQGKNIPAAFAQFFYS